MLKRKRMAGHSSTGLLSASTLVGFLLALFAGLPGAEAADLHREAGSVPSQDATQGGAAPQTLSGARWYVVTGGFNGVGDAYLRIGRIAVPAACKSPAPLRVSLYNPAGYFIGRIRPGPGGPYLFAAPRLGGRYLLRLAIADPACAGLRYSIDESTAPNAVQPDNSKLAEVRACDLARHAVAVDTFTSKHGRSEATRKRYAGFLKHDRATAGQACHHPVHA